MMPFEPLDLDDFTFGSDEPETLTGDGADNLLATYDGGDVVDGQAGHDALFGGSGRDTLQGGRQSDLVEGGRDNDLLGGGRGNDTLRGGEGNDTIRDGRGDDTIKGDAGNDLIILGDGNDLVLFSRDPQRRSQHDVVRNFDHEHDQLIFTRKGGDVDLISIGQQDGDDLVAVVGVTTVTVEDFFG